ncbi:MAG: hypothetical protein ACOZAK_02295 [Patescibacteria group bacterium]
MSKLKFVISLILITLLALLIRVYQVTSSPPAPYWEEVALGYDAYSILQTGKDHHGNSYPLVAFESFGDWKPAGYFYAIVPFIKLLGLNVLAVRLPSVLAGTLLVLVIGWLVYLFTDHLTKKKRQWLSLISMILASISPWLIQFSRAGWEVNLATLLLLLGIVCGWQSLEKKNNQVKPWALVGASVFFVAAMYVYHSARVIAPLLGLFFGFRYIIFYLKHYKKQLPALVVQLFGLAGLLLILLWPFIQAWGSPILAQRVAETTIFTDVVIIEQSNQFKDLYHQSWWTKFVFHRWWFYLAVIISQFLSHFSLSFLFITGDEIARHSSQYFGLFYPFEILFLLVGSFLLLQKFSLEKKLFLIFWLVVGVLPAAISRPVPHALRILPIVPALMILLTLGLAQTYQFLSQDLLVVFKKIKKFRGYFLGTAFISMYLLAFISFYRHLLIVYPQKYGHEWQVGYQQMLVDLEKIRSEYPDLPVYITREQGRPAMYYWFYTQTDPKLVQAANLTAKKDQGEYLEFAKIKFVNSLNEVVETPAITADFIADQWQVKVLGL